MDYINVDVTRIDTEPKFPLGHIYWDGPDAFRYIKYSEGSNAVTATAGHLGYRVVSGTSTCERWEVTDDASSATTKTVLTSHPMGFFQSALTDGDYGWIQIAGFNRVACLTDGTCAAGARAELDSSANGRIQNYTSGLAVGKITVDDVSTALAIGGLEITLFSGAFA